MTENAQNRQSKHSLTATQKPIRESNMELFRCLAMLFVVGVHANFWSIGSPTTQETMQSFTSSYTRFFFESLCIGSVNMFVLLSGWFGIRPKVDGFAKLLFQSFFYAITIYVVFSVANWVPFSFKSLANRLLFPDAWWFIKAYIALYLLSPCLNALLKQASQRQIEIFLVAYFAFQTLFEWLANSMSWFNSGMSPLSFIFLYVLARYIKMYQMERVNKIPRSIFIIVFLSLVVVNAFGAWLLRRYELPDLGWFMKYSNPLVIAMALSLLLFFSRLKLRSRLINWFGASTFSVYLIHSAYRTVKEVFRGTVMQLYQNTSGLLCIAAIALFVVVVFVVCVLIDQIRIGIWNVSWKRLERFVPKRLAEETSNMPRPTFNP